jgi:putative Ca2+/H+ antiporter (TMEM165/GDT1 family)
MIQELVKAFFLIFVAEMGDKTQILAMAFATKFPVKKVLMGIFIGSLLNHGLAVLLGSYISTFIPLDTIQIIAGFAFVGFSLWTLKAEEEEEENEKEKAKFGPVLTVAMAFFIGELGDKTQLSAITLAADANYPLVILAGTVSGMIVTGGLGIIVGKKIGDKIPEFAIKIIASAVFMFFGLSKLFQTMPSKYLTITNISIFLAILIGVVIILLRPIIIQKKYGQQTLFKKRARDLYNYYHKVGQNIDRVCLGTINCGECQGNNCIVGYTKTLIHQGMNEKDQTSLIENKPELKTLEKHFDKEEVLNSLKITIAIIKKNQYGGDNEIIHKIRRNLETILFGKCVQELNDWTEYAKILASIDEITASKVLDDGEAKQDDKKLT